MKNKQLIINKLIKEAEKSTIRCQHAAAIIKKGNILSIGFNYKKKNFKNQYSIHAEKSALLNCNKKNIKGAIMIVIRLNKINNKLMKSKPCLQCQNMLKKFNLKNIYYSTGNTKI